MNEYLVLLREDPSTFSRMSPSEMQAVIQRYSAWVGQLRSQGRLSVGKKLTDEGGRMLRAEKGRMVASTGPYAEVRDVVSGLFIISAASYEEAQALLADCPHLEFGHIELREVDKVG
jgi:hypothetical protein